jgi:hypothetical protein
MSIDRYNKIANKNTETAFLSQTKINAFIPNPSDNDYKNGYIERYFIQKSNDINSYIYEIAVDTKNKIPNMQFYTLVSIRWRLTGKVESIKQSNFNSIRLGSKYMQNLYLYLPNLLQFSKQ